jgi:hypothetical protein
MDLSDYCLCGFVYFCLLLADLTPQAHREPPRRALSDSPEPQQGGDAVERSVRRRRINLGVHSGRL